MCGWAFRDGRSGGGNKVDSHKVGDLMIKLINVLEVNVLFFFMETCKFVYIYSIYN